MEKRKEYKELFIKDLELYVLNEIMQENQVRQKFDVCEYQTLKFNGGKIDATIIGESHIISIKAFGVEMTELVACVKFDAECIFKAVVSNVNMLEFKIDDGVLYHFEVNIVDYYNKDGEQVLDDSMKVARECKNEQNCITLFWEFPCSANAGRGLVPETRIILEAQQQRIAWETIHVYDIEQKIVHTASCITKHK